MTTQVLDWLNTADQGDIVRIAAQALAEGKVVAFPTETVYGVAVNPLVAGAVERLTHGKERPESKPLTLAIASAGEVLDWVPGLSPLGQRLARRCWPGPITLVSGDGVASGLVSRLSAEVRQCVMPGETLGLRVPDHDAILKTMRLLPGSLVLSSANRSGEPPAVTAEEVRQAIGDEVDLVIDGGPCRYRQPSTVVQVNHDSWKVLREGVLTANDIRHSSAFVLVFLCTGNTCRSPLAEALFKKKLAERLHCTVAELPERGFIVLSAGLAAMMGDDATPEAVDAARTYGADLSGHQSRPATIDLLRQADLLVGMTRSHLAILPGQLLRCGPRVRLLDANGEDIPDPIGGDPEVYRVCARQIWYCLDDLLSELAIFG